MPRLLLALTAAALLAAPSADAKRVKDLWATVNVCDTKKAPDDMGVRARAPGDGSRAQIYMRFTAQYRTDGKWRRGGHRPPGWRRAGPARFLYPGDGSTFTFSKPGPRRGDLVRGVGGLPWRDPA